MNSEKLPLKTKLFYASGDIFGGGAFGAGVSAVAVMPYTIKDFFVCIEVHNFFRPHNLIDFRNNCSC